MCNVAFWAIDVFIEFDWNFLFLKANGHFLAFHTHELHWQWAQVYIILWWRHKRRDYLGKLALTNAIFFIVADLYLTYSFALLLVWTLYNTGNMKATVKTFKKYFLSSYSLWATVERSPDEQAGKASSLVSHEDEESRYCPGKERYLLQAALFERELDTYSSLLVWMFPWKLCILDWTSWKADQLMRISVTGEFGRMQIQSLFTDYLGPCLAVARHSLPTSVSNLTSCD